MYGIGVNASQEEGLCTPGAKGYGIFVAAGEAKAWYNGGAGGAERVGELGAPDGATTSGYFDVKEGCGQRGSAGVQVSDSWEEA